MFQFLCMFFPPLIAVALRSYLKKKEKSIVGTLFEYCIWTLLINCIVIIVLCLFYDYGFIDIGALSFSGFFSLKYISLSLLLAIIMALLSCNISVGIKVSHIYNQHIELSKKKKIKNIVRNIISSIMLFLSFIFLLSTEWMKNNFGLVTLEKILFQMKLSIKGANESFVYSFILQCIVFSILLVVLFVFVVNFHWKKEVLLKLSIFSKKLALRVSPFKLIKRFIVSFTAIILLVSIVFFAVKIDIINYCFYAYEDSSFIAENFVDTKTAKINFPENKRNLIYIYMESIENTYMSEEFGGAQPENLMPELTRLSNENISFSNTSKLGGALQAPGTGWTVAAMVSNTCGIPLKIPIEGNSYGKYSEFLPGAYSLGDILKEQGYNQTLLVGSDAEFGGRKDFFEQHGNYRVLDYYSAIDDGIIPSDYKVWWGFEDQILYKYAKKEIIKLAKQDKPFNFTMLTVDTHHIGGYVCNLYRNDFDKQYANVIACASRQISEFIEWIKTQDFYKNTTIVITGDHLSMDPEFFNDLDENYTRTVYNAFINSAVNSEYIKNRDFATFDMFPTALASIGIIIENNRLGLGTNLFSGEPTLMERYGVDEVFNELNKNSNFYNNKFIFDK